MFPNMFGCLLITGVYKWNLSIYLSCESKVGSYINIYPIYMIVGLFCLSVLIILLPILYCSCWIIFISIVSFMCSGLVGGVYFAETLNKILARNWRSFATQNYFDPYGIFLSALWSGPLLFIAIIILVSICNHLIIRLYIVSFILFLFFRVS